MRLLLCAALLATTGIALADDGRSLERPRASHAEARSILAAPQIATVVSQQIVGRKRHAYTSVTAHLTNGAPLQVAALVVYRVDASGHRVALPWGAVDPSDDEIEIYLKSTGADASEPRPGDHLVFAWLDSAGQLSPTSGELVVTKR